MLNQLSSSLNTMSCNQKTVEAALAASKDCRFGENCKWQRKCKLKHPPLVPIDVSAAGKSKDAEPSLTKEAIRTQDLAKSSEDAKISPCFKSLWAMVH
jgi:hypothetical protein